MALALAFEVGGSHGVVAVVHDKEVLVHRHLALDSRKSLESLLPLFVKTADFLLSEVGVSKKSLLGVALLVPSLIDPSSGRIVSTNDKFPGAEHFDFKAWAYEHFGTYLVIENDARAALIGECYAGAGQGIKDVLLITIGTGIGAAVAIGGVPLRTKQAQAGTLGGHIPVSLHGRPCTCGALGCMEAEASTWALPAIAESWPGYGASTLSRGGRGEPLDFRRLFKMAAAGDLVARQIRDHCIRVWAVGTVGLIHAYGPEIILFSGGVLGSAAIILPEIRAYVSQHAWVPTGTVTIAEAALGINAALLSAIPLLGLSQS